MSSSRMEPLDSYGYNFYCFAPIFFTRGVANATNGAKMMHLSFFFAFDRIFFAMVPVHRRGPQGTAGDRRGPQGTAGAPGPLCKEGASRKMHPLFFIFFTCTCGACVYNLRGLKRNPSVVRNAPAVVHLRCKKEDAKGTTAGASRKFDQMHTDVTSPM